MTIPKHFLAILLLMALLSSLHASGLPIDTRPLMVGHLDQGKAEFNIYDAAIMRYGEPRNGTVTHIWVKEPWDAQAGTKWDGDGQGNYEVIKMIQVISYPTGIYRYEQMWSGFWKRDTADLVKWSLTHHEACGNTFKQARIAEGKADYVHFSYFEGHGEGGAEVVIPEGAVFYDELPLKLRLLVNSGLKEPVTLPLFSTVIHAKSDPMQPPPATIRQVRREKGEIEFEVAHNGGAD